MKVVQRHAVIRRQPVLLADFSEELRLADRVDPEIRLQIGVQLDDLRWIARLLHDEVNQKHLEITDRSTRLSDTCRRCDAARLRRSWPMGRDDRRRNEPAVALRVVRGDAVRGFQRRGNRRENDRLAHDVISGVRRLGVASIRSSRIDRLRATASRTIASPPPLRGIERENTSGGMHLGALPLAWRSRCGRLHRANRSQLLDDSRQMFARSTTALIELQHRDVTAVENATHEPGEDA